MSSAEPRNYLIALTGATGFIGGRIACRLLHCGWRVRLLVRPGSEPRLPADVSSPRYSESVELCTGSMADSSALEHLLESAEAVVHCAGLVRGLTQADFDAVNVAGTEALARMAASQDKPPRFVLISSLAAREPDLSPYALSKHRAEEAVAQFGDTLPWLALRPPAVYGPGDRELLPLLVAMTKGVAPILGASTARFSLLFVDDLARAVAQAIRGDERGIFELHDGKEQGYDWEEVIAVAEAFRGAAALRVPIPEWLLRMLARLAIGGARLSGRPPMLSPAKVNELRHPDWVCDNSAICRVLDWQPKIQFATGLRLTLAGQI